jgi:hypothetical protein
MPAAGASALTVVVNVYRRPPTFRVEERLAMRGFPARVYVGMRCWKPTLDEAVEWGAAHGILVQETPGDTTMVTQAMVEAEVNRAKKGGGVVALR